jgi:hypothetical protein
MITVSDDNNNNMIVQQPVSLVSRSNTMCSLTGSQNTNPSIRSSRRESLRRFFKLDFKKFSSTKKTLPACIDKNQIGSPTGFVHVNHVGLSNTDSGLDV